MQRSCTASFIGRITISGSPLPAAVRMTRRPFRQRSGKHGEGNVRSAHPPVSGAHRLCAADLRSGVQCRLLKMAPKKA